MDTKNAVARGQAAKAAGERFRVFDWHKAATLIRTQKPGVAHAGLEGDMEWTGGLIWTRDGIPPREDTYTYLGSNWAIPVLVLDGEEVECWAYQDDAPQWDVDTYWPDDAVEMVLRGA